MAKDSNALGAQRRERAVDSVMCVKIAITDSQGRHLKGQHSDPLALLAEITGCVVNLNIRNGGGHIEVSSTDPEALEIAKALGLGVAQSSITYVGLETMKRRVKDPDKLKCLFTSSYLPPHNYYVSVNTNGPEGPLWWTSWCPACKRPQTVELGDCNKWVAGYLADHTDTLPLAHSISAANFGCDRVPRYAYVAAIWGEDPGFVLGALVLGSALRRRCGAEIDRILLHTADVGIQEDSCLKSVWTLKLVDQVDAAERLFLNGKKGRFAGTFNKIHAMGLIEYDKVLLLDIDLVVRGSLDELFNLPAPAALGRGANSKSHGERLDGRRFFHGAEDGWWQATGINAGVVLLAPSERLYETALSEITDEMHPEHIPSAAPEQDYLSRFYAPWWSHICVKYNYQLHQVLNSLESCLSWWHEYPTEENWRNLPTRLSLEPNEVIVIHFSGTLKLWDLAYTKDELPMEEAAAFATQILRDCCGDAYERWVARSASYDDYALHNVEATRDTEGKVVFRHLKGEQLGVEGLITTVVTKAEEICKLAVQEWRRDLTDLLAWLPYHRVSIEALQEIVVNAALQCDSQIKEGQDVEILWEDESKWYPARVTGVGNDGTVDICLMSTEWFGRVLYRYPCAKVRPRSEAPTEVPGRGEELTFQILEGQAVEIFWTDENKWYPGIVTGVGNAGVVAITLTCEEWAGCVLYDWPKAAVRPLREAPAKAVFSAPSVRYGRRGRVLSRLSTLLLPLRWLCCHLC